MASRLDRLIAWFAPERALARARARTMLRALPELQQRNYEAARPSRATYGWLAGFTDANAEVWGSLPTLRARSRELVRNNPHARKAKAALVNNCVGSGILPRAKTGDKNLDKRIGKVFRRWSAQCDAEGHFDFFGLQKLAVGAFFESGEAIVRRVPRPMAAGLPVPLQLEVLEGDLLDHNRNAVLDDGRIIQGVEIARGGPLSGMRRAYWMFEEHPGEMPMTRRSALVSRSIPAAQLLHLYEKERPGQQRGVPWFYAAMLAMRTLDTYEEAELVRKRLEACLAAIVLRPEELADPASGDGTVTQAVTDQAGNVVEAIEPGMFYYARGGSDIKITQPAAVPGYADYKRSQLHSVAAGCLITYELLTGDLSSVNYSSIRAGLLEYRRLMNELQWLTVIPVLLEPAWRSFVDFAVAAGQLPRDTPYDVAWSPPQFESVDPLKDSLADQLDVRSGFRSLPEAISARGFDPEEVAEDQAHYLTLIDALGLVLDSDPRKTAKTGVAQADAPNGDGVENSDKRARAGEIICAALKRAGLNGQAAPLTRELLDELDRA
jgi:lambda family phage portal protein